MKGDNRRDSANHHRPAHLQAHLSLSRLESEPARLGIRRSSSPPSTPKQGRAQQDNRCVSSVPRGCVCERGSRKQDAEIEIGGRWLAAPSAAAVAVILNNNTGGAAGDRAAARLRRLRPSFGACSSSSSSGGRWRCRLFLRGAGWPTLPLRR